MAQDNAKLAAELNRLSLATAAQAVEAIRLLERRYPAAISLEIAVQALLTAAVSLLVTGRAQGLPLDVEAAARRGIETVLKLKIRHHHRRPDGSFDPVGKARH